MSNTNGVYLEVTFRNGRALAAYLYLPRRAKDRSVRTRRVAPGLVVDLARDGRAIGVEITAPTKVTVTSLNRVLRGLGAAPLTRADLAPLRAAQEASVRVVLPNHSLQQTAGLRSGRRSALAVRRPIFMTSHRS